MRTSLAVLFLVIALLLVPAAPSPAWGHSGGGGGHGGGYHGGWYGGGGHWHGGWYGAAVIGAPWWGLYPYPYPYWYYSAPYYAYPGYPAAVAQGPSAYIEQDIAPLSAPPPAPPRIYWYYCASAQAYYPKVRKCPEAWIKVPPRPE